MRVLATTQSHRSGTDMWSAVTALPWLRSDQSPSPVIIGLVIGFMVISLGIHEAAHGWVAWKRGDPTAKELGRITLNPLAHIDLFMTLILPTVLFMTTGIIFGGAKPVPVQIHRLKHPLRDMSLVAIAGPASNFLLAALFALVWKASLASGAYGPMDILPMVLLSCTLFNLILAVFNLVPIPPLDGSRVMTWLLPASLRDAYVGLERWGMFLIFFLMFMWMPFRMFVWDGVRTSLQVLDFLTGGSWS